MKFILLKSSQNNQKTHTNCTYKQKIASGGACGGLNEAIRTNDDSANWMAQKFHTIEIPEKNTDGTISFERNKSQGTNVPANDLPS